jgi:hypothetical protein
MSAEHDEACAESQRTSETVEELRRVAERAHRRLTGRRQALPVDGVRTDFPESFPGIPRAATRPIRRLAESAVCARDPDDDAARQEAADQALVERGLLARAPTIDTLRLQVVASLAVYEAIALGDDFTVKGLEAARAALLGAIDQLVVEAYSKATLERTVERLWGERQRLERALDALVPQGRMDEFVQARIARAEVRHGG